MRSPAEAGSGEGDAGPQTLTGTAPYLWTARSYAMATLDSQGAYLTLISINSDRDGEALAFVALRTFVSPHILPRRGGLDAGEPHRIPARRAS
jgi:hypothetical protein